MADCHRFRTSNGQWGCLACKTLWDADDNAPCIDLGVANLRVLHVSSVRGESRALMLTLSRPPTLDEIERVKTILRDNLGKA